MPNQKWRREFVSISKPVQNHFWLRFLLTHDFDPCMSYQKCLNRPNKNFLAVNFQFLWRFCGKAVVGKDSASTLKVYTCDPLWTNYRSCPFSCSRKYFLCESERYDANQKMRNFSSMFIGNFWCPSQSFLVCWEEFSGWGEPISVFFSNLYLWKRISQSSWLD